MPSFQYVEADAVATRIREELAGTDGFKSADVEHIRALGTYKVVVRFEQGKKIAMESPRGRVDVEVVDGNEPPTYI